MSFAYVSLFHVHDARGRWNDFAGKTETMVRSMSTFLKTVFWGDV